MHVVDEHFVMDQVGFSKPTNLNPPELEIDVEPSRLPVSKKLTISEVG